MVAESVEVVEETCGSEQQTGQDGGISLPYMPPMSQNDAELSDTLSIEFAELKEKAYECQANGDHKEAVEKFSQAMKLGGPVSALLLCRRATSLLKTSRPHAVLADCTRALEVNPDSATAFKLRGKAYKTLEDWEHAASDLNTGLKIDYDEDTREAQLEVDEKWQAIAKERRALELEKERKEEEERRVRADQIRKAREDAAAKAKEAEAKQGPGANFNWSSEDGSNPLGSFMATLMKPVLDDPEVKELMKNPKVKEAVDDLQNNPMAMLNPSGAKNSDPEVQAAIQKIMDKLKTSAMGAMGGAGGGMPDMEGMGGMPGM